MFCQLYATGRVSLKHSCNAGLLMDLDCSILAGDDLCR